MNKSAVIISGTSRGIGYSLLQTFVGERIQTLTINRKPIDILDNKFHQNFIYDLQQIDQMESLISELLKNLDLANLNRIFLVNNAATIGKIGELHNTDRKIIREVVDVNLISPTILSSLLIRALEPYQMDLRIIHISSGAAFHPIEGLGAYCFSKAGLEMASKIIDKEKGDRSIKSITIGPGVVDTDMQQQLRSASPKQFKEHDRFVSFKEKGMLQSPEEVGQKIVRFILDGNYKGGQYYTIDSI